jgi:hypothetical protein
VVGFSSQQLEYPDSQSAFAQDLAPEFGSHFVDESDNVSFGRRGLRSDNVIRKSKGVQDDRMVLDIVGIEKHLPELATGGSGFDTEDLVRGFHGCGEMNASADAADGGHGAGNLLQGHALEEFFIPAKLNDLEKGVVDISIVIQEDGYFAMTLQTGNGIDLYFLH